MGSEEDSGLVSDGGVELIKDVALSELVIEVELFYSLHLSYRFCLLYYCKNR